MLLVNFFKLLQRHQHTCCTCLCCKCNEPFPEICCSTATTAACSNEFRVVQRLRFRYKSLYTYLLKAHHSCTQTGTHAHMTLLELACQQQASSLTLRTMQTKVWMLSPGILAPMMQQFHSYVIYSFLHTLHTIKFVQTQGSKGTGQISR